MSSSQAELYIGLMSGTSMDGIDAALVDFSQTERSGARAKLISTHSHAWPDDTQRALIDARNISDDKLFSLSSLDSQTAEIFANACFRLIDNTSYQSQDIIAIGNHGQTIRHRPDIDNPFSLQIGNAKKLAELTRIDVISDFRTADIKVGGQGAPLAPAFHQAMFQHEKISRVIVNIGGIANITVLPKNELSKDKNMKVTGFDCGPGNTLMDAWTSQHKQQPYDTGGAFASSGKTNATLLASLLMDEYFQLAPPKSTGFEYFNLKWLGNYLATATSSKMDCADVQSTLCDLTALSIIRAINQYAPDTDEIYICGGGVHNKVLMHKLQTLTKSSVTTTETLGVHPDWVEAMAFAWLAYQNIHQQTGNLPSVTGATKSVVLGKLTNHTI